MESNSTKRNRIEFNGKLDEVDSLISSFRSAPLHCIQTTSGLLGAEVYGVVTPRVEVRDAAFGGGIILTADIPFSRLAAAIRVTGNIQLLGSTLTTSNMGYLTSQNGLIARLEPGSRWCNVSFDWDLIRLTAETHEYVIPDGDHSCGMPVRTHDTLKTLLSRTARGLLYRDVVDAELEDELARALLRALNAGCSAKKVQRKGQWRTVHKVIDFILAEYANPITVTDFCRIAGVGERNLEYLFRSATGFTMQQYLMNHRLHQARAMLLGGEYEQVKDVANACGIPHAGRFSQYYKQMFGQLPRETLLAQ